MENKIRFVIVDIFYFILDFRFFYNLFTKKLFSFTNTGIPQLLTKTQYNVIEFTQFTHAPNIEFWLFGYF